MKLLFIIDPLATLTVYKDSSVAMMRAAQSRGHEVWVAEQPGLILRQGKVTIIAQRLTLTSGEYWYSVSDEEPLAPHFFDAILMRKDPPFDNEYLYSTYLLELAQQQGARVINDPAAIRGWNEKLSVARFSEFAPPFLVTRQQSLIREFLKLHGDVVVKPLDGMGGSSIFRLTEQDPNISVILETITQFEQRTIMVQRYLPAIKAGDKRVLVINGEPLPYCLARIPAQGETRGNLAAGGTGVAQPLSERDIEIATAVGKTLKSAGLVLVGLDIIGDNLTEVNVTSPTCMVEIATQTQHLSSPCNPAEVMVSTIEELCA